MKFVWALLALVGCDTVYGLTGRDEDAAMDAAPGDDANVDAAPQMCVAYPNPTEDEDGDEIRNQSDACPMKPDRGYNEDGDCDGDACDLCPQELDKVLDVDGDNIGDPCDLAGPSVDIARMEGFGDIDEIVPLVTGWMHDPPAGTLATTMAAGAGLYAWANSEITPPFVIETQFEIPATATTWTAGIVFGVSSTRDQTPDGYVLVMSRLGPDAFVQLYELTDGIPTYLDVGHAISLDQVQRLRIELVNRTLTIRAGRTPSFSQSTVLLPATLPADTSFGVGVIGGTLVTFDYLYEVHHQ